MGKSLWRTLYVSCVSFICHDPEGLSGRMMFHYPAYPGSGRIAKSTIRCTNNVYTSIHGFLGRTSCEVIQQNITLKYDI